MNAYSRSLLTRSRAVALKPRVVLAGSVVAFTGRLLALLEDEFPQFSFERVSEATLNYAEGTRAPHLLVCEEMAFGTALRWAAATWIPVAVAFDEVDVMAARLAEHGISSLPRCLSLLPMTAPPDRWLAIVRLLLLRETFLPAEVLHRLWRSQVTRPSVASKGVATEASLQPLPVASERKPDATAAPRATSETLSTRELKVLSLMAHGKQNKVIATELGITVNTAKLHVHRVLSKLGARNRTEAAALYLAHSDRSEQGALSEEID